MNFKASLSLCLFAFATVVLPANAKIIRVNNQLPANDRANNIYASLTDAVSEAMVGDSLLIEPSATAYAGDVNGQINITKRLTIIGTGYFLTQNPATQFNAVGARLACAVYFQPGSNGSVITGIAFAVGGGSNQTVYINENNIAVNRCYLSNRLWLNHSGNNSGISGIRISQCFLAGGLVYGNSSSRFSDVRVENNIILEDMEFPTTSTNSRTFSNVTNNTFVITGPFTIRLTASSFNNNVVMITGTTIEIITTAPPSNNLANVSNLGTASGNRVYGSGDGRLFAGDASVSNFMNNRSNIPDNGFRITAQTAAYNTMGSDGKEPGAFGGANPYVLSGLPQIPAIYELTTTGTGSAAGGLPVTIKVKSN